jgi:hypothetical protein
LGATFVRHAGEQHKLWSWRGREFRSAEYPGLNLFRRGEVLITKAVERKHRTEFRVIEPNLNSGVNFRTIDGVSGEIQVRSHRISDDFPVTRLTPVEADTPDISGGLSVSEDLVLNIHPRTRTTASTSHPVVLAHLIRVAVYDDKQPTLHVIVVGGVRNTRALNVILPLKFEKEYPE